MTISLLNSFLAKRGVKEEIQNFDARNINPESRKEVEKLIKQKEKSYDESVSFKLILFFLSTMNNLTKLNRLQNELQLLLLRLLLGLKPI